MPNSAKRFLDFSEEGTDRISERLASGDPGAIQEVVVGFGRRLVGLAELQLRGPARLHAEPEDAVQSAFRSFFDGLNRGLYEPSGWGELWALLVVITVRKCRKLHRHWSVEKRSHGRETAIDPLDISGREPSPEAAAMLRELVERLLANLAFADRSIVEASLQGQNVAEIAERLGRSERTVQRVRQGIRDTLRRELAG